MSVLGDVFGSLQAMSQLQLLLAFVGCIGYALAQGGLISSKGRRIAWSASLLAVIGFALESTEWMNAAMLIAFGIVGLGLFVAGVWLTSRLLGFSQARAVAEAAEFAENADAAEDEATPAPAQAQRAPRPRPQQSGPAHSV